MKAASWKVKRFYRRLWKRRTAICGVLSFCLFLGAFCFDASFWRWRLSDESLERASTRVSTNPNETSERLAWKTPILTRAEQNRRLADSALRYWDAYGAEVARTISVGLARWDVDQATWERVEKETVGAVAVSTERGARDERFVRESDFCATREALDVFEDWDEDSLDIDVAQDFLRELDDGFFDGEKNSDDQILWTFDAEKENPLDSVGLVAFDDFEPITIIQAARRASDASARVFFLLTLGNLFFLRRESVLNSVLGLERVVRELDACKTLWNVWFRFFFLRTSDLAFVSSSRRRAWSFFLAPTTNSLSMFSVVRLNN